MKFTNRFLSGIAAIAVMLVGMIPTTGCSSATIADLAQTLGNAGAQIATLENNPTLAAKLKADTAAAVSAIASWKSGSPATEAIEALNIVEDDLDLIPGTSTYAPLIDLAIGTVESILALLPTSAAVVAPATLSAHTATLKAKRPGIAITNPPKTKGDFKKQWNAIVAESPVLAKAKI